MATRKVPQLRNGDRLSRAEFERRYEAMPWVHKAELIEGTVYMPSPVRLTQHGMPHMDIIGWLAHYRSKTPGLLGGDNATTRLDEDNEPQPDVMLFIPERAGGTAKIDEDGYVTGPPELVVEVAASSVSIDLHAKLNAYRRNGVKEYLVWRTEDEAVDWLVLRDSVYQPLTVEEGVLKSPTFAGLWLDPDALLKGNLPGLFAAVDRGVGGAAHQAFVQRLAK
jgi:Uma2 family endonuclease